MNQPIETLETKIIQILYIGLEKIDTMYFKPLRLLKTEINEMYKAFNEENASYVTLSLVYYDMLCYEQDDDKVEKAENDVREAKNRAKEIRKMITNFEKKIKEVRQMKRESKKQYIREISETLYKSFNKQSDK
jgi:hypothetical protein